MRNFSILFIVFVLIGCGNKMLNANFERLGVYDDNVKLVKTVNDSKEVIFIPMKHLGTPVFYENVKRKVDSLNLEDFFFYTEGVKTYLTQDIELRKYRKITGKPMAIQGYKHLLDSIIDYKFEVKLKREIIDQPSFKALGIDSENGKNVDASLTQMINYYEMLNGETILEDCDFETEITEETKCKDKINRKSIKRDLLLDSRNQIVLDELNTETRNKIAIIYGEAHILGILEGLKERGYQLVGAPPD